MLGRWSVMGPVFRAVEYPLNSQNRICFAVELSADLHLAADHSNMPDGKSPCSPCPAIKILYCWGPGQSDDLVDCPCHADAQGAQESSPHIELKGRPGDTCHERHPQQEKGQNVQEAIKESASTTHCILSHLTSCKVVSNHSLLELSKSQD